MSRGRKKIIQDAECDNMDNFVCDTEDVVEKIDNCIEKIINIDSKREEKIDLNLEHNKKVLRSKKSNKPLYSRWKKCHVPGKINQLNFNFRIGSD